MTQTIDLPVLGMTCAACVRRVEKAVAGLPGVETAEVNLPLSRARLVAEPDALPRAVAAIRDAGYEVPADVVDTLLHGEPARGGAERLRAIERAQAREVGSLRRDATIAIVLAIPLLVLGMAHGLAEGTA